MTPKRWNKIKEVFAEASELDPALRLEFLNRKCGNDAELRKQVEILLGSSEDANTFLEIPAADADTLFVARSTESRLESNTATGSGTFIAGTILAERYRIIGLLGKGGMGAVYRAEDIKLDQTVALKFLPEKLERNEDALKRFIGEVKTARQVSHTNVCKVFDIGDIDGKHFISMEFIDGDDLSQLLRRIGRLPSDKATEISRQICFGLHAIHDAGILHRDLKPANIIIDSSGKARITDFGIAGFEEDVQGAESRVGTPAYMSPEQITGKEVTSQSDIYSLGLLLYEIYTGKQAVEADSFEELIEKQKTTQPTNPSTIIENIEPIVEKTINRCLEKNPAERPKSALQVAMALPGGNPLEAAIAAGETPSPEMVAAAPKKGSLSPFAAGGFLAAMILCVSALIAVNQTWLAYAFTPFEKSPEILAEKSREIIKTFGYQDDPTDIDYEFEQDPRFLEYYGLPYNDKNYPDRKTMLRAGQPYDTFFLYRQSPNYLEPSDSVMVTETEPQLSTPNMISLKMDVKGRLLEFVAVPPSESTVKSKAKVDWETVFKQAGLDLNRFTEAESKWTPPVFTDSRRTWTGALADFPSIPIRVETGEFDGKIVFFRIVAPWNSEIQSSTASKNAFRKTGIALLILSIGVAILGSFFFAYRNIRVGRGDLRGALKLTSFLFLVALAGQILLADHVPTIWGELSIIYEAVSYAGITAVSVGLIYIALEPFVRRSWSELLISWSRLMAGDFRDPMVGRDVLVGGLMGVGHLAGIQIALFIFQFYLGKFDIVMSFYKLAPLNSMSGLIATVLENIVTNTAFGLVVIFIAFFFFLTTGKKYLGIGLVGLLFFVLQLLIIISTIHWLMIIGSFINSLCLMYALGRHGLLGVISFWVFFEAVYLHPVTFDTGTFYFPQSVVTIVLVIGVSIYAAYIALKGKG